MGFEYFNRPLILFFVHMPSRPDVRFAIFTSTNHVPSIVAECGVDLAACILVPAKLDLEVPVPEIVEPDTGVITCNKKFNFSVWIIGGQRDRVHTGNLASFCIPASGGLNMDLCVWFQPF